MKLSNTRAVAKAQLIARAEQLRGEIEQTFLDADHWNRINPAGPPIDVDPDGELRRLHAWLGESIRKLCDS